MSACYISPLSSKVHTERQGLLEAVNPYAYAAYIYAEIPDLQMAGGPAPWVLHVHLRVQSPHVQLRQGIRQLQIACCLTVSV